ncbi:hypothetical protein FQZ97_969730 [compost metagenome]
MLIEDWSSSALPTQCQSPTVGETASMAPAFSAWVRPVERTPSAVGSNSSQVSCPRSTPTTPQTVWLWTGVRCPGPQTKLTTEKRSSGSQCSRC